MLRSRELFNITPINSVFVVFFFFLVSRCWTVYTDSSVCLYVCVYVCVRACVCCSKDRSFLSQRNRTKKKRVEKREEEKNKTKQNKKWKPICLQQIPVFLEMGRERKEEKKIGSERRKRRMSDREV